MAFLLFLLALVATVVLFILTVRVYGIKGAVYSGRLFGVDVPAPKELSSYKAGVAILLPLTIIMFLVAFVLFVRSLFSGFVGITLIVAVLFIVFMAVFLKMANNLFKGARRKSIDIAYRNSFPYLQQGLYGRQITQDIHSLIPYTQNIYVCDEYLQFKRADDTVVYIEYSSYQYENLAKGQMALLALYIYCSYINEFDFALDIVTIPGERPRMSYGFVGGQFVVARQSGTPDIRIMTGYNIFRRPGVSAMAMAPAAPVNQPMPVNPAMPMNTPAAPVPPASTPAAYKYCPKCGAQLPSNATFCSFCGTQQNHQ